MAQRMQPTCIRTRASELLPEYSCAGDTMLLSRTPTSRELVQLKPQAGSRPRLTRPCRKEVRVSPLLPFAWRRESQIAGLMRSVTFSVTLRVNARTRRIGTSEVALAAA